MASKTQCLNVVVKSQASWALLVHPRHISSCHGFFIAAMVIVALLLSSRTFLLALLSLFIARVVTPAFGAFGYCGRAVLRVRVYLAPTAQGQQTLIATARPAGEKGTRYSCRVDGRGSRWPKFVSHQGEHPRHCQVNGHRSTSRDFAPQQNAQSRRQGWYKDNKPLRRWPRTWERSYIVDRRHDRRVASQGQCICRRGSICTVGLTCVCKMCGVSAPTWTMVMVTRNRSAWVLVC